MMRGPFEVTPNAPTRDAIARLREKAFEYGIYEDIERSLAEIEGRLELHPETWGEFVRDLASARFKLYRQLHDRLSIEYAVHDDRSFVLVTALAPTQEHALYPNM